jgi:hypothetical protein
VTPEPADGRPAECGPDVASLAAPGPEHPRLVQGDPRTRRNAPGAGELQARIGAVLECSIEGCFSPVASRGWCNKHNMRWRRHGDPSREPVRLGQPRTVEGIPYPVCSLAPCLGKHVARGFCKLHYVRWAAHGDPDPGRPARGTFVPTDWRAVDALIAGAGLCDAQWAWIAGIYEGEGSFVARRRRRPHHELPLMVSMVSSDLDVLERLRDWTGWGSVHERHPSGAKPNWKPTWGWSITRTETAIAFGVAVDPWLLARRRATIRDLVNEYLRSRGEAERWPADAS